MLKTPQDKKRASLMKDRRNAYGENAKSSRKNIPRSKARVERAYRRGVHEALRGAVAPRDEASLHASERQIAEARLRLGEFRKSPDISLAEHIRKQKRRRP